MVFLWSFDHKLLVWKLARVPEILLFHSMLMDLNGSRVVEKCLPVCLS